MPSQAQLAELYGAWAPRWPSDAADLLDGWSGRWWVAGGFALDAAAGITRPHSDLDIVIPRTELSLLRGWLGRQYQVWCAFQGAIKPLRPQDQDILPIGTNQVWLRKSAYGLWEYDVQLDPSDHETWRYRKDPANSRPLADALFEKNGIRYLKPEIVLAYSSARPRLTKPLEVGLPLLDDEAKAWLVETLPADHAWQERIAKQ
ncbi:nucleotidyltransferase domain-containing protein [Humidisolicoccus flavus]|uniref:nucleotidyltransferase domain-containing protein n=1 Tax=Humidisolicoccus flavus TaxID=3111414 RepID=UPI003250BCD2